MQAVPAAAWWWGSTCEQQPVAAGALGAEVHTMAGWLSGCGSMRAMPGLPYKGGLSQASCLPGCSLPAVKEFPAACTCQMLTQRGIGLGWLRADLQ